MAQGVAGFSSVVQRHSLGAKSLVRGGVPGTPSLAAKEEGQWQRRDRQTEKARRRRRKGGYSLGSKINSLDHGTHPLGNRRKCPVCASCLRRT